MRFSKPKNGHFNCYCFECKHWAYTYSRGCANMGICSLIKSEPTEQDAYDKPCGAFTHKNKEGGSGGGKNLRTV